jgi:hypothetical protein
MLFIFAKIDCAIFGAWDLAKSFFTETEKHDPSIELEYCPICGNDFVCPVDCVPENEIMWRFWLHCGECGHERETVVDDEIANRYDIKQGYHEKIIQQGIRRISKDRMTDEADLLAKAFELDLIGPSDFTRES